MLVFVSDNDTNAHRPGQLAINAAVDLGMNGSAINAAAASQRIDVNERLINLTIRRLPTVHQGGHLHRHDIAHPFGIADLNGDGNGGVIAINKLRLSEVYGDNVRCGSCRRWRHVDTVHVRGTGIPPSHEVIPVVCCDIGHTAVTDGVRLRESRGMGIPFVSGSDSPARALVPRRSPPGNGSIRRQGRKLHGIQTIDQLDQLCLGSGIQIEDV